MSLDVQLQAGLKRQRDRSLYRTRQIRTTPQGAEIIIDDKKYLNFCSNDYLGLTTHSEIKKAANVALKKYGMGSGGSALITGYTDVHQQLEEALAEFTDRSRVMLFTSGFAANTGTISAIIGRKNHLFMDRLCHASLIDGARLSGAKIRRFQHLNISHLGELLDQQHGDGNWVVTESLFSMDGDVAPLRKIYEQCNDHSASLYVDDAHGFGLLGKGGAGGVSSFGLTQEEVPVLVATFGKALGVSGAFVAGSETLIETLIQRCRTYVYSTAMPTHQAAAILKSLELVRAESWRREKLFELISRFREEAARRGIPLNDRATGPIQPILIGDAERAVRVSQVLKDKGLLITAIRPPTVPQGGSRLRITLSACHTFEQLDDLLAGLAQSLEHD